MVMATMPDEMSYETGILTELTVVMVDYVRGSPPYLRHPLQRTPSLRDISIAFFARRCQAKE